MTYWKKWSKTFKHLTFSKIVKLLNLYSYIIKLGWLHEMSWSMGLPCIFKVVNHWKFMSVFYIYFTLSLSVCVFLCFSYSHYLLFFLLFFSSRLQTGVSSLQGGVFIRGICQEATLSPLLPQWMYSSLVGAGKGEGWMWSLGWRVWTPLLDLFWKL